MRSVNIMPFYAVCDQSISMAGHIEELNDCLREQQATGGLDRAAANQTRLCLIGFSESAEVLLPLVELDQISAIPRLTAQAETNFGAAFTVLRETIGHDVDRLSSESHRVGRPTVFFLSDGQPTDPATWSTAYATLTDPNWPARPEVIAFGIGDADPVTISRVASNRAFIRRRDANSSALLRGFVTALMSTITRSAPAMTLRLPEQVPGFRTVSLQQRVVHNGGG